MDVDISKWEKIAHDPDGDSTSKRSNFHDNADKLLDHKSYVSTMQLSPKQPSARSFAAFEY